MSWHAAEVMSGARSQIADVRAPARAVAEAFDRALDYFLRAVGDPLAHIDPVVAEHPGFVMAHVLRGAVAIARRHPNALPLLRSALDCVSRADAHTTTRERAYLAAAEAWLDGRPELAAERYTAILHAWPRELLALRLAQSCHFFLGRRAELRDVVRVVWPKWSSDVPGYEYLLAIAAFGCAENDDNDLAEALGREALDRQPAFPFAIHSVAHALAGRGEFAQGAQWMQQRRAQWAGEGRMAAHNAWHAAMFDVESGHAARALATLDDVLIPCAADSASDACDATSLLWRLEIDGLDPGRRWSALSDCWAAQTAPGFWPFLDLHAAITFNLAGDYRRANALECAVARCARGDTPVARTARAVTLPGLRGIESFAAGAYADAAGTLRTLRRSVEQIGGSHAQQELFDRMLRDAERRLRSSSPIWRPRLPVAA